MSRAARLDSILEAGARVLGARGWHGTTMREVSKEARTGVATLYHYLSGREDLLYQTQMRILRAGVVSAQAALAGGGAQGSLRALLTDHIRRVQAMPFESTVFAGPAGPLPGERGRRVEDLRQQYLDLIGAAVEGALRLSRPRPVQTRERVVLLLGMADRLALDASSRSQNASPARLATRVLAVFRDGARAR